MAANAERNRRALLAGIFVLVLALGLQIILAKRDALAENPAWRPLVSRLCLLASCQLAAWRQPEAFVPVRQAVAADPEQAGVLRVQLSFRNEAQWPQPWPQIENRLGGNRAAGNLRQGRGLRFRFSLRRSGKGSQIGIHYTAGKNTRTSRK